MLLSTTARRVLASGRRVLRSGATSVARFSSDAPSAPVNESDYEHFKALKVSSPALHVLQVDMNRPKALNAFNEQLWQETREVFEQAHLDSSVRAVVLTGSGAHFTSGLDLAETGQMLVKLIGGSAVDAARRAFKVESLIRKYQASFTAIEKCSVPVISAIQGACIGAGLDLVSACDIRYCSKDVFFSIKEVDVGLAADVGTLQRMPKVVGNDSLLRELAYTAREMHAAEALSCGFVSRVLDDKDAVVDAAIETATTIAAKSPVAVEGTKRNLCYSRDHSVDEGLAYVATWNAAMLQTVDITKGMQAFATKQVPRFDPVDNTSEV